MTMTKEEWDEKAMTDLDALVERLEKRALVMTDDPVYRRALAAIAALRGELADKDTVPRSRYNVLNDQWLDARKERDQYRTALVVTGEERDALRAEVAQIRSGQWSNVDDAAELAKLRAWEKWAKEYAMPALKWSLLPAEDPYTFIDIEGTIKAAPKDEP